MAAVAATDDVVTVTPIGAGTVTFELTASDGELSSETRSIALIVESANRAPMAAEIPPLELTVGGEAGWLSPAEFFSDPDGNPLSYTVGASSDPGVATVATAAEVVTVTPIGAGTATFKLTASDGDLSSETRSVTVAVEAAASPPEVRIAARRVSSGSVEFGLQVRSADGAWQELIQPQLRFLPAGIELGRWLVSSAIDVGDGDWARSVQVAARRRSDGSVEFALQVRSADGVWGERLLPGARFLPADSELNRWLSSSPLGTEGR